MELTPKTRKEVFLAAAGGQDITTPTPVTREEVFLDAIAKGGGGGGSGGGVLVVHMVYDEVKDNDYTDKTWKEIHDAPMAVIVEDVGMPGGITVKNIHTVARVYHEGSEYNVDYYSQAKVQDKVVVDEVKLVTDSENGYLTYAE